MTKKTILAFVVVLSAMRLLADATWELVNLMPLPVDTASAGDWQMSSLGSLYQSGGGFAAAGREGEQPVAEEPTLGTTAYRLEHASWGFGVSELRADFNLGEYCTDFPEGTIDWAATQAAITNSTQYKEGYVFFDDSATSDERRVLFTRGGEVSVPWVLEGGVDAPQTYTIGHTTSARPYRIFWTEYPFSGPKIDLSAHPDVRLLGDPAIVQPLYAGSHTSDQTGVSNVVRGVVFDERSKVLRSYCNVINEETREFDGPEGQFVLAYYDSGMKDNLVATIVVEACSPDVAVIKASVGDELRPAGGGYDIAGLESYISAGDKEVDGDKASPYLYKHKGKTNWSPKEDAVFAISPTDATTTSTDESAPWRADIYWKAPDPLDVLWPFEEDWYEISWPTDAPEFVVSGDDSAPGLPIFAPTNLTTAVCAYQDPANIARADESGCVWATQAGWFTMKLTADDNVWFQPVKAVPRTDPSVAQTNAPEWRIGSELRPMAGLAAGNAAVAAGYVDGNLPGYIYSAASAGRRNWNPRLYHEPKQESATEDAAAGASEDSDPYASLKSAIYPVNTSDSPIEVWWSRTVWQPDLDPPIKMPCVVQRYTAVWPKQEEVQNIVIASQKGSDGKIAGGSAGALYLENAGSSASLSVGDVVDPGQRSGLTFAFWFNPSPDAAGRPELESGLVATLFQTDDPTALAFRLSGDGQSLILTQTANSGGIWSNSAEVSVPRDAWTHVALVLGGFSNDVVRAARLYANAKEVWSGELSVPVLTNDFSFVIGGWGPLAGGTLRPGAAGVAVDGISAWATALGEDELMELWQKVDGSEVADVSLQLRFNFDDESDLAAIPGTTTRYAHDTVGFRVLASEGPLHLSPGAPELTSGIVKSDGDVKPVVYWQNDSAKDGFNPNDEHAFLMDAPDGCVVHALRCDLGSESGSRPLVLVQYEKGGKGAMRAFGVELTNDVYSALGSDRKVGLMLTPPHPLDTLDKANNDRNYAVTVGAQQQVNSFGQATADSEVVYYDRHSRMWARRDGSADVYYYYDVREGFWFPDVTAQPAVGTLVPWLSRIATNTADVLTSAPMPWRWQAVWPDDSEIPTMKVAQTLTKADAGLPEVWSASSMAVVYPVPLAGKEKTERVVRLIDPTVAQTQPLAVSKSFPDEYGFTLGSSGTTHLRTGKYYFTGVPPSVADRFYVDAANQQMALVGQYVEKKSGGSYLQLNVLTPEERAVLLDLCKGSDEAKGRWRAAVNALATNEVVPNTTTRAAAMAPTSGGTGGVSKIKTDYTPVDHYGLVASGEGSGYVTLIENDCTNTTMVSEGSTISMHVIKVVPELYAGDLAVIVDPLNKLSEQLTIAYTSPFGGAADDFEFEWRRIETQEDGSVPTNYPEWRVYGGAATNGLVSILIGANGADLKDLQNMYYALRYRAAAGTAASNVTGGVWSDWCGPTLAEGWVQRVLNSVTPFAQRCADFSTYKSDIAYSMLQQIGAPYHGDVALNNDNLNNIGLLELYRTVLNKAEKMSIGLGAKTDLGVNKQLLLAASRLAELYGILGDEAYSDAKNPTISQMFSGTEYDSDSLSSSVFCFQNQLPTLLDEELALLRGRTSAVAPNMKTYPYYNRLIWNFTKGVTEGEVAYVNNYMIYGSNGEISQEQAAAQYPQGHGDAYGHYLSMLKSFYHLARNPYFDWYASMTEMLVGSSIVNVDYFDEEKFAEAAVDLARTTVDVMDLTSRKAWREGSGEAGSGYFDADERQAFGYGEWATRGGYGALCNWAVVNALLPTNGTPVAEVFEDKGVKRVTRSTASSLAYLPRALAEIESRLAALDSGMNPLGLSDNAVPFDLEPTEINGDTATAIPPFEQILARTEKALANANAVLAHAHEYGSRLAQIALQEAEDEDGHETTEAEYTKNLVAIYGTPLAGDIGPGGTYAQGYNGPDIYHYMYVDLKPYGLSALDSQLSRVVVKYSLKEAGPQANAWNYGWKTGETATVTYTLTPDGIPQAPAASGVRYCEGSIQESYRGFLAAYSKVKRALSRYEGKVSYMQQQCDVAKAKMRMAGTDLTFDEIVNAATIAKAGVDLITGRTVDALEMAKEVIDEGEALAYKATPKIIGAGLTVNTDPSSIVGGLSGAAALGGKLAAMSGIFSSKAIAAGTAFWTTFGETIFKGIKDGFDYYDAEVDAWERIAGPISEANGAADELMEAYGELVAAEQAYRAKIAEGDALQAELAMVRRHWANTATSVRYADMYNRIQRNNALTKYSTAFDTAQRYVYMLAKVYDYETGLLSSDPRSGDTFMRSVISARSLGEEGITTEVGGTLWDAVTRMSANWDVLKGRLGVNNPERTTTWFSLRYSLFRILPGAEGDMAWRDALRACWRDDILSDPEFRRYCQPPQPAEGAVVGSEPGLVISFPTTINLAENLFGRSLLGGESTFSSSDYAVRLYGTGVRFKGYNALAVKAPSGLATTPNIYLVPTGRDYMRTPVGATRAVLAFKVLDQVMPIPYDADDLTARLKDPDWFSTLSGGDAAAEIRRHSTMAVTAGDEVTSTRLVGRSAWNDRWLLVIPASSLSSDRVNALKTFINGLDSDKDGQIDVPGVSDIEIGFRAYSRSGN